MEYEEQITPSNEAASNDDKKRDRKFYSCTNRGEKERWKQAVEHLQ